MMTPESAVKDLLSAYAPLTALVGGRIFPVMAQAQAAYPYLVYADVFNAPQNSLAGWSGMDNIRLQVDCWAKTYAEARNLATQVRVAMSTGSAAFRGLCINEMDGPVEAGLDLYHVIVEFSLWTT